MMMREEKEWTAIACAHRAVFPPFQTLPVMIIYYSINCAFNRIQ